MSGHSRNATEHARFVNVVEARALDAAQRESVREFIVRLERDEWRQRHWLFEHPAPREMLRAARAPLDAP